MNTYVSLDVGREDGDQRPPVLDHEVDVSDWRALDRHAVELVALEGGLFAQPFSPFGVDYLPSA